MIKTAKRLMSFMLVLVMCVTFCPIEPLRTVADDPTPVTYECQPQSKTYDSEMDNVTVTWSMNVQRHWRVTESVVYMVNGNHSSFVARLNNDWSTNKFSYEFSVVSPNNYKYFVRTYYCENVSSPSSIYSIDSEEFTISYADKRFLRQPESGPYNQSTGKLDVKWSTNFKPEKVEVWNYSTIIDTLSPIGANGTYSFDAAVSSKPGYYLRAYWDDEHYKESNTFGVTSKLEFTTQPEDVEYYMNSAEVEVTCDTNFNPYKVEVIRKTGDEKVVYSSLYSHMTSSIGCCFVPTVDTVYFVRAYMNENAYVDSESFRAYYPAGFKFLKEPQDGQYRAATMDFEAYFQLSFTPAQIQLMYYDEDDEEFKNTDEYELLSYSGNNYTLVVPYDYINTPLKVIAEYYGIDSDGNAKVNSISSRVFIARDIAASFIEQPTGSYLQPLLYPGIDYKLSWKTDFKPVKVEITYNHRWEDNKYVWDTAKTVTSDLSSDMTITGFTPEAGVKYKVYAYYTDDDYVSSDEFSDDMSDLRFELQPSASYTLPNDKDPYVCTYEWSTSFVPDKIVFAYDYVDRHNWKKAFSFTRNINLYNKINTSLDVIEAGRNYCLLAYYGEGEYDFVVSDYFSASDEKLKELYHPNIMSQPWDGENSYYRGVLIPYNPVRVEHYLRGSKLEKSDVHQYTGSDLETFQNAYGINMAYLAPLRID
ncbi:MAG: hypothetical protein GXY08_02750, partial [Ruminococcus sp.]|nr:hypothetical protein [Ruminococcus sp.]